MASNTSAISFCFLFFILCPNVFSHSNSAGCQFNEDIKLDYQTSICPIPSNYSLFNDQFPSGIYKCNAQQLLICMEAGTPLDQGIRVSSFGKFVQLNYALNSRTCRTWWWAIGGVSDPTSTLRYQAVKYPSELTSTMYNPFAEFPTPTLSSIPDLNGSSTVVQVVPISGWFV